MPKLHVIGVVVGVMCVSLSGGCIRSYTEMRGVTGRLVDAESRQPLREVPVTVAIDNHEAKLISSNEGTFAVKPRQKLVFWIAGDWAWGPPVVDVSADGYMATKAEGTWKDDSIELGDVPLTRQPPITSMGSGVQDQTGQSEAGPRLKPDEVLKMADAFAKEIREKYEPFDLKFYPKRHAALNGGTWGVYYTREPNRWPGDHFTILIDDATGKMKYVGGA